MSVACNYEPDDLSRIRWGGEYLSAFKGAGLSFEEVRPYFPGDDIRRIDWNVTARTNTPFIKRFLEERELTIILALDVSASMRFGSQVNRKREVAADIGAILATCAEINRDRLGFLAFTDQVECYLPPSRGVRHTQRIIRELLLLQGQSKKTDLNAMFTSIYQGIRRRAIVFVLSDFPSQPYQKTFRLAARKHDLIVVRVTDRFEKEIPQAGLLSLKDSESDQLLIIDTHSETLRREHSQRVLQENDEFLKLVRSRDVDWIDLNTQGDHLDRLLQFFQKRRSRKG